MSWFFTKSPRPARHNSLRTKGLQFERLESRELMAADVIWENNAPPPGFAAKLENGSLVFVGSESVDKVTVHDIVAKKTQKQLTTGEKYIEIQHQDAKNRLRRAWVKQDESLGFSFLGKGGNDYFQYIDTTLDPAPRRDRPIEAHGGAGDDTLYGYTNHDILFGDEGNDQLFGGLGSDLLAGGLGDDRLWGDGVTSKTHNQTTDSDYLEGGEGTDKLYGWQGGDILNGGNFWKISDGCADELYGGSEGDHFYLESFTDPRKNEAKDFNAAAGDTFDNFAGPLSYEAWLAQRGR